jgi:tetratricopeptide (TPR) repeat protein
MADYFISYTSTDREWAHWIAKELEALGHTPHVYEWEVQGGDDIYRWMEQRHDAADHVLCVVSDDYLKAPFSTLERNAAMWQSARNRPGFVLFVVVRPARLPTLADHVRRCELFDVSEEAARIRLREFLARREKPQSAAFPGAAVALSNVPIRLPAHFMGREEALAAVEAALAREGDRLAVAALHGLRGVGKTTIAAAYADSRRSSYRATWWLRAQSESSLRSDLVGLGARLSWVGAEDKEEPALAVVMERLRQEGEGILLIFDNAADANAVKRFLPRGGHSHVLVTSNAHAWRGVAVPIEIRPWPTSVGAEYLLARTGAGPERAAAEALSEALGGLPLAHEQAAAYCERLEKSLADYHRRFQAAPAQLLDDRRDAPGEYHDQLTVMKTFTLAIDEAAQLHGAAQPLILHAALLAGEPIPLFLFAEGREKLGEPLASALAGEGLDEAVAALRAFALLDRETIPDEREALVRTQTIRLHRLLREAVLAGCAPQERERARRALIEAMAAVYPPEQFDPRAWVRARRLDAHTHALLHTSLGADCDPPAGAERPTAALLHALASYRHGALAAYAQARPLYERALAIFEKLGGRNDLGAAAVLNDLALLLQAQGDLDGARPLHERALAVRETALGPDHPAIAESLSNLAFLLHDQRDLAEARPLYERALAIHEKAFGGEHPSTATSLNNLALLLQAQGDLDGAQPLNERALAIYEKALGEHPSTAASLNNLALLLKAKGELARARPLYERALAIDRKVLGPEHPDTATDLGNLALLLQQAGEPAAARPLFEAALAIRAKVLGESHLDTAHGLNNLAALLHEQGELAAARPLYERALAIFEKLIGPEHPHTNRSRRNLARLLVACDRASEALPLGQAALTAHESALGRDHAWTRDSARVTAAALDALARAEEAAALRERYRTEA